MVSYIRATSDVGSGERVSGKNMPTEEYSRIGVGITFSACVFSERATATRESAGKARAMLGSSNASLGG
jgi:hypothetical protein